MKIVRTGPTRDGVTLDLQLSNFNSLLTNQGMTSPIANELGTETDHLTVHASFRMPRVPSYEIQDYSYYHITDQGDMKFGEWLGEQTWSEVFTATDVVGIAASF